MPETGNDAHMVSIKGLDKIEVLRALYAHARPLGMGALQYVAGPLDKSEAEQLLNQMHYFDYVKGRIMKVSLKGDEFSPSLYDRDNGDGAAQRAISELRTISEAA